MLERTLLQILKESRYTTVLSGFEMLQESGDPVLRDGDESYDIEQKYGYLAEEMLSSSFFSTRTEQFFEFYRTEILSLLDRSPGRCFTLMAEMERKGLFHSIITRRIFGLPDRAGCRNVINMHGSVYDNYCPHCGEVYPMEYVRDSDRVPLCKKCGTVVRPKICLYGEMVDNQIITKAAEEVNKADVLVVLGTNLKTYLCSHLINYFEGNKLILVNPLPHFSDQFADIAIHESVESTLDKILKELGDNDNNE